MQQIGGVPTPAILTVEDIEKRAFGMPSTAISLFFLLYNFFLESRGEQGWRKVETTRLPTMRIDSRIAWVEFVGSLHSRRFFFWEAYACS